MVESRNVTSIETPDAPLPPAAADRESPFPEDTDTRGGLYYGDDSDSSIESGNDGDTEGSDDEMDEDPIEPDDQRTLLRIAASKGLHVEDLDDKTAFLNDPVEEDVWVYQASDSEENDPVNGKPHLFKLRKLLYGLRRSPLNWNTTFT
eukprot:g16887.t1